MSIKRVSPTQAQQMMDEGGYIYVDVRSIPEFDAGHPVGSYNVPLLHAGPAGMAPNPAFLDVMQAAFPKDTRIILGCRSGVRSLNAAQYLIDAGYTDVVDQRAGYEGPPTDPGWSKLGLATTTTPAPERTYKELEAKVSG